MRAEDVKPGMWVRCGIHVVQVDYVTGLRNVGCHYASGAHVVLPEETLAMAEPWVPRVGEWVRFNDRSPGTKEPWRVDASSAELGATWYRGLDARGGKYAAMDGFCEPCAPPEAKPEMRAGRFVREATPEQIVAAIINDKIPPEGEWQRATTCEEHLDAIARDHNATCSRCGGRAYQGIGLAKCVEPVCDDPETREPDGVVRVVDTRRRWGFDSNGHEDHRCYVERVWEAIGRGVTKRHPTSEGAIAAWREAVRRG
jgi:hypothetical protein